MQQRTRAWSGAAIVLAMLGCTLGPSAEVQRQLEALAAVSAEKDSLLQAVVDNSRLMSEISATLATVNYRPEVFEAVSAESPVMASRDSLRLMIENVTTRVTEAETRLRASRQRIRTLTAASDSLKVQLEETIDNFESVLENQRETITTLTQQVSELEAEAVRLAAERAALADSVDAAEKRANTAYYVIGTKDQLLDRGIVVEEGGSRVLFIFGKRGKTLRPAHELNESDFTAIDIREVTEIPMPDTDEEYRIASRQNVEFLEVSPDEDGDIRGSIRIASPQEFWKASKYLIIVQS